MAGLVPAIHVFLAAKRRNPPIYRNARMMGFAALNPSYCARDTSHCFPSAAAIRSPSRAAFIGRLLTVMPSGRSASLTPLATAAGAPR